ncbi:hypothetical protein F5887DRAFT_1058327 [Amanita rubescens]|nr:hypothetical protein F5887DRAFT_1058327 [Amanita rubescens]
MPQAPAFSRLQLAAALLEYDNELTSTPRKAQDSAIFAHLRRNPAAPPQSSRRSDYLRVSLPSESGSLGGRESAFESRRSRASRGSLDALRNPFGHDDHWSDEEEGNEEELEVDLASWGLDALIAKEKGKSVKGKAKATAFSPHSVSSVRSHIPLTNSASAAAAPRRAINTSRSVSLGGIAEHPDLRSEFLEAASKRRRSFGSPLDLVDMELSQFPLQRPRSLSHSALRPPSTALHSGRSPSPTDEVLDRRISAGSQFANRRLSRASVDSRLLQEERAGEFLTEAPSDNIFAIRPPSPSRLSRFDPKATSHGRTISNISRGSRIPPEQAADVPPDHIQDHPKRQRKYSTTLELLRPKVLAAPAAPPAQHQVRDGFLVSTDGPPLPPGARSAGRNSMMNALDSANKLPIASNSFTPNPLMNLSLSQMTFRNTLHIGVFTGDQRPSMMSRAQTQSTLIDPATLNNPLSRKNSLNAKPLLNFDDEQTKFKPSMPTTRMVNSRSVFGVDTLWEREMEKKRMEQEQQQEKKKGKKGKKRGQGQMNSHPEELSIEPPVLPLAVEEVSDEDQIANATAGDAGTWFSDSEEEMPRRTTGVGPPSTVEDADSEEDMPLSAARATRLQAADDSDEEKPLSTLLQKAKQTTPTIPPININFNNLTSGKGGGDDDDDDKPLGLRASTILNRNGAFHPEQQRRTQYQMMAQQQQQMMMQAQLHNSMFFSQPSMLGSGFFGPPVMPPMMMQPPIPIASSPPADDSVKFGRVDKWRHDVAVEGSL